MNVRHTPAVSSEAKTRNRAQREVTSHLSKITLRGFKSFANLSDFELGRVSVLIGPNGAGKSNLLGFFELLGWMVRGKNIQEYIGIKGGADDLLYNGAKYTHAIHSKLKFSSSSGAVNEYAFTLQRTDANRLIFSQEEYRYLAPGKRGEPRWKGLGVGHEQAKITSRENDLTAQVMCKILQECTLYQFHDTSHNSPLKMEAEVKDCNFLRSNGGNLVPILYDLREQKYNTYQRIVDFIRYVLPDFGDFELTPEYGKVALRWRQRGTLDKTFGANLTSDGSLRFMALATLLLLPPEKMPDIILLDEPELGLHPYAVNLISELILNAGKSKQVIVATQSPLLLNEFSPSDIIVAERNENDGTKLARLNEDELRHWLEEYRMGDLWRQNVIGGNP